MCGKRLLGGLQMIFNIDSWIGVINKIKKSVTKNTSNIALNEQTLGYKKKNLLKNKGKTATINGITFTVNEDGSVTANGTNTGNQSTYAIHTGLLLEKGKYIFSSGIDHSLKTGCTMQWAKDGTYYSDASYPLQEFDGEELQNVDFRLRGTVSSVLQVDYICHYH